MNSIINFGFLSNLYQSLYSWFADELFTKIGIYQVSVLLVVSFLSFLFSKLIIKTFSSIFKKKDNLDLTNTYLKIFIFPILFLIFTTFSKLTFKSLNWNYLIINIFSSITAAWIIIKAISLIFKKAIWLRPAIFIIWMLTFLNILDLLDKFFILVEKVQFNFGETNINLLFVIKGFFVTIIAFWAAFKISDYTQKRIKKNKNINATIGVLLSKTSKIVLLFFAGAFALNIIGIKLTAFAVLGGAVGVGIGFGLQKIVSNFISGFILLLDKSIKPGDVIEIDDTFGTIQSMSARYITVLTLEGKEHLIPNEDLITNKVINWSHSNTLIRIEVVVGVSYSTDILQAMGILRSAAKSVKRIYLEKEPVALLTDFGNSSIDLKVQFWIMDPEDGIENICSNVRLEIWRKFKDENIEIPFPQQEIYIKALPEINNTYLHN